MYTAAEAREISRAARAKKRVAAARAEARSYYKYTGQPRVATSTGKGAGLMSMLAVRSGKKDPASEE